MADATPKGPGYYGGYSLYRKPAGAPAGNADPNSRATAPINFASYNNDWMSPFSAPRGAMAESHGHGNVNAGPMPQGHHGSGPVAPFFSYFLGMQNYYRGTPLRAPANPAKANANMTSPQNATTSSNKVAGADLAHARGQAATSNHMRGKNGQFNNRNEENAMRQHASVASQHKMTAGTPATLEAHNATASHKYNKTALTADSTAVQSLKAYPIAGGDTWSAFGSVAMTAKKALVPANRLPAATQTAAVLRSQSPLSNELTSKAQKIPNMQSLWNFNSAASGFDARDLEVTVNDEMSDCLSQANSELCMEMQVSLPGTPLRSPTPLPPAPLSTSPVSYQHDSHAVPNSFAFSKHSVVGAPVEDEVAPVTRTSRAFLQSIVEPMAVTRTGVMAAGSNANEGDDEEAFEQLKKTLNEVLAAVAREGGNNNSNTNHSGNNVYARNKSATTNESVNSGGNGGAGNMPAFRAEHNGSTLSCSVSFKPINLSETVFNLGVRSPFYGGVSASHSSHLSPELEAAFAYKELSPQ